MKFSSAARTYPLGAASFLASSQEAMATSPALGAEHEFIRGAALVGGTNGMFFDNDNNLIVAQVYGRGISKLNSSNGDIAEALGFEESVVFPDDVTVGPDGTLYWSDYFYFSTIMMRRPGEDSVPLLRPGSVPFANPVTLDPNGVRLFYAQCWNPEPVNGVYEHNLVTNITTTLLQGIPGCASNAMDYWEEALYTPRPYEGRIVKIDLAANNTVSNVTTGWGGAPNALKFDSQGRLYAANTGTGEVALIDYDHFDTENNRQVVAQFPLGSVDNLALDRDDRLFVSSTSDGDVVEVLSSGELRTVSPGLFSITMGVAVLKDTLFTVHPGALFGFDSTTGERVIVVRSIPGGAGGFLEPTSVTTWNDDLVLLSFPFGAIQIYDPFTETLKLTTIFGGPIDAHPFQDGLIVTEVQNGTVVFASGDDLSEREVIYTSPGVTFLTGNETDVYLTNILDQTLYRIIQDGEVLDPPTVVATGFAAPEGIVLLPDGDKILLVDAGKESLEEVDTITGNVETIATDLGFLPGIPGLDFGFANDVAVGDSGAIYVSGDRANVIYKFESSTGGTTMSSAVSSLSHAFPFILMRALFSFFLGTFAV